MSDRSAKLLLRYAEAIERTMKTAPHLKMAGVRDVPTDVGLVSETLEWARGYRLAIKNMASIVNLKNYEVMGDCEVCGKKTSTAIVRKDVAKLPEHTEDEIRDKIMLVKRWGQWLCDAHQDSRRM